VVDVNAVGGERFLFTYAAEGPILSVTVLIVLSNFLRRRRTIACTAMPTGKSPDWHLCAP